MKVEQELGEYAIALQQLIEGFCRGAIPESAFTNCPHHAKMLSALVESGCDDERMCVPCFLGQDNCNSLPKPGPLPALSARAISTACIVLAQAINYQVEENFGSVPNTEWCTNLLDSRDELEAIHCARELPKPKNKETPNA